VNLKRLYGTTEAGFAVAMQRDGAVRPETVGTPLDRVEIFLLFEREIVARSLKGMSGYLHAAPNSGGRLPTGDSGHLHDHGQLHVEGRPDTLGRLSKGRVLSPRSLKSGIRVSRYVREAAVFSDGRGSVCALIDIDTLAGGK